MVPENPTFQKPLSSSTPASGIEAKIFTMPERYRHAPQGIMHEPEKKAPPALPPEVKAPVAPSAPSLPKPGITRRPSSGRKWILISGIAILAILWIDGFVLVKFVQKTTQPVAQNTAPVVRPAPQPKPTPQGPKEPEQTTPATTSEPFPVVVTPGTDTDSDGLTDTEEELIYRTNPRLPDTDADGFLDGNEVFHRYNPGGTAPGTLLESGLASAYQGTSAFSLYEIFYQRL